MPHRGFDEQKALQELAQGSEQAFAVLYERYWLTVFGYVKKIIRSDDLAEDITQEIFVSLWKRRQSFVEVKELRHYLAVMSRNLVYRVLNKLANETEASREFVYNHGRHLPDTSLDDLLRDNDYKGLVKQAMENLPPTQKRVFNLGKIEGLSQEAIAERLSMSREAVKKNMMRALQQVRQHLKNHLTYLLIGALPWLGIEAEHAFANPNAKADNRTNTQSAIEE